MFFNFILHKKLYYQRFIIFTALILFSFTSFSQVSVNENIPHLRWTSSNPFRENVFIENSGQYDNIAKTSDTVRFGITGGAMFFFTSHGWICRLDKITPMTAEDEEKEANGGKDYDEEKSTFFVKMTWLDCEQNPVIEVEDPAEGYHTFGEKGLEKKRFTGYKKLIYKQLYKGVDVEFTIPDKGGVKYTIIAHQGADISRIRMKYSGDTRSVKKDKDGNLIITTDGGNITDHFPGSYSMPDSLHLSSGFVVKHKVVGFMVSDSPGNSHDIVIDPWTTIPVHLTTDSIAYDVASDNFGNIYVSGGSYPFKLSKYNSSGVYQWTFTNPSNWGWSVGTGRAGYSKFCVLPETGTCFIGEGYTYGTGPRIMKIDKNGVLVYTSVPFTGNNEIWTMFHNRCTGQLIGFGGGTDSSNNVKLIADTNLLSCVTKNFNGSFLKRNDIACALMDDNGDFYALMTSILGNDNNTLQKSLISAGYSPPLSFKVSTFADFYEAMNSYLYITTVRANALAMNHNYLFSYNSRALKAWNKSSGALLDSVVVSNTGYYGSDRVFEGIAVDECNNIWLGGYMVVYCYTFNGTHFVAGTSISSVSIPSYVACINLNSITKTLEICGSGFVTVLSAPNCGGMLTATPHQTATCYNNLLSVTVTGGLPPYEYHWSTGDTTNGVSPGPGIYYVTVTDQSCKSSPVIDTFSVSGTTTLNFSFTSPACFGASNGSATVVASGIYSPFSFKWNTFPPAYTSTITGLVAGTYTVTVTDNKGCNAIDSVTVTQPVAPPPPVLTTNSPLCFGTNVHLSTTSSGTYHWTGPGGFTSTLQNPVLISPPVSATGVYYLSVTDVNGCIAFNKDSVIIGDIPKISMPDSINLCSGMNASFSASVASSYSWSGPDGFHSAISNPSMNDILSSQSGYYYLTAVTSIGCTGKDSVYLKVYPPLLLNIGSPVNICPGRTIILHAHSHGGSPPFNFFWNGIQDDSTLVITPTSSMIYSVYINDALDCFSDTTVVKVNVAPPVNLVLSTITDTICKKAPVKITAIVNSGQGGPYTVHYPDGQSAAMPMIIYPDTTMLCIFYAQDSCGQKGWDTLRIVIVNPPEGSFTSDVTNGCEPLTVSFNEPDQQPAYYKWDFGDGSATSTLKNPVHQYLKPGVFRVSLTLSSNFGCFSSTKYETIDVYPKPVADFDASRYLAYIENTEIFFVVQSVNSVRNTWTISGNEFAASNSLDYKFSVAGSYDVTLVSVSKDNCVDTITKTIVILDRYTFYAPSAFSPGADGINDRFNVSGHGIDPSHFTLLIFDRWGEKIFETHEYSEDNPSASGWDGKVKGGTMAPSGSYTWLALYRDLQGVEYEKAGIVTVIK